MYRAGLVYVHKDSIKEANKILFNFIRKGKDKVKRSALICDVKNGGLRAPHWNQSLRHSESCAAKKFVEAQQSSWKLILSHYLKQVGGKLVLGCGFDIKKLPIKLPRFYEQCLQVFAEHSTATEANIQNMDASARASTIIWNNKHIFIDGKSVFHYSLFKKGIVTLEDLVNDKNEVIVKQNLSESNFTPMEVFHLMQIYDALPRHWRNSLIFCGPKSEKAFVLNDHIKLRLKNEHVRIDKAISKRFTRKYDQSMRPLQLHKLSIRINSQVHAWNGMKYMNCHLRFLWIQNLGNSSIKS